MPLDDNPYLFINPGAHAAAPAPAGIRPAPDSGGKGKATATLKRPGNQFDDIFSIVLVI